MHVKHYKKKYYKKQTKMYKTGSTNMNKKSKKSILIYEINRCTYQKAM